MLPALLLLIATPTAAVVDDPTSYVEVIDLIDLLIADAFNGSYLSSTPFRGTDTNTSFIPGQPSLLLHYIPPWAERILFLSDFHEKFISCSLKDF